MTHGRLWRVDHSIMINVTWRHLDQSAKQLIVGHTTNIDDTEHQALFVADDVELKSVAIETRDTTVPVPDVAILPNDFG